ncbi:hypothetical protein L3Y34_006348 [Caenorhabditis briggsae]|uniref:Sdz-33 F-box domain-containing protein n=1 Tax=Caenorhabditis briggsae TaxID=6238 RepID=A0AAE8ZXB4_CAEBR|nr:hypothetical protein L3Y34_006348 [Caenorhabditis briggsae]
MVAKNVQQEDTLISFRFFHTYIEISHIHGIESWRKQDSEERSQSDWLAHLLSIFNKPIIQQLEIGTINHIIYLDAIKNLITKCKILKICENCSDDLAKIAVIKLSAITLEKVETYKNRFVSGNYISDILTYNLKSLHLNNSMNQYEVNFEDLLSANIRRLSVHTAIITDKELNQFVQVWMKSSDKFYRLQRVYLSVSKELSRKEILRGIRYKNVDNKQRVNRDDMKELIMDIGLKYLILEFPR